MMPRILFVDDEPHVLDGLREGLRPNRSRWEMSFALGSGPGLLEFEKDPYDVVVSDLTMPGMDGAQLLEQIRLQRPLTGRIVLGGEMDVSSALRTSTCAHRVLVKPCDRATLEHAIEAGVRLSVAALHPTMKALVAGTMRLPSPPTTYLALTEVMRNPESTARDVAAVLEKDVAMTAQVLRVVNSPLFGVRCEVSRVEQAVALLGREMVKSLVLGADVFRSFKQLPAGARLAIETHHDHSLLVGRIAQIIAGKALANDAFTVGMLHDVGVLLVATMTPDMQFEILDAASERQVPPHVVEKERWGTTHADIGAHLLGLWGLPVAIVQGVADHHDPAPFFPTRPQLATIAHVADALAHERSGDATRIDSQRTFALGLHERLDGWRREVATALEPVTDS
jgi:HD-like signal output (HDOD) protein